MCLAVSNDEMGLRGTLEKHRSEVQVLFVVVCMQVKQYVARSGFVESGSQLQPNISAITLLCVASKVVEIDGLNGLKKGLIHF